ncbi:hypothetical protein [Streptosporangium saharense]|uniref:hypothetical protein n=1 Tax=Streptosporangium saharense TaxID=1706840 RepID=UPI00341D35ED
MPPGKIAALTHFAHAARAQAVAELADDRKLATLVAFAATMAPQSADDAVEVFDLAVGDLLMRDPGARTDLAQTPSLTLRVRHRHHQRRTGHLFQHRTQLRQPAQPYRRRQVGDLPAKTINISTQERHTLRICH